MPGDCRVWTGTEKGWIGDLQTKILTSWLRPEWAQESPFFATCFFLDAFAVSPRVSSVGRGLFWCSTVRNEPGSTGSHPQTVEEFAMTLGQWGVECLQFGWCLSLGITKNDDACHGFQAVNAQPKFLGCQPLTWTLSHVACLLLGSGSVLLWSDVVLLWARMSTDPCFQLGQRSRRKRVQLRFHRTLGVRSAIIWAGNAVPSGKRSQKIIEHDHLVSWLTREKWCCSIVM